MVKEAYLQVYQPLTMRKNLLSSAIECIKLMEDKERILRIMRSKHAKMLQLKKLMNEIKEDYAKLESSLPSIPKLEVQEKSVKSKLLPAKKESGDRLNNIEDEILEIKKRIEGLQV